MQFKNWNIEAMTGYKPQTTFYMDFSIADHFGEYAIKDTYERAFEAWKTNVEYLTELVMVLNWKIWEHYETKPDLAAVYNDLFERASEYAVTNLEGDDLAYYYKTTD